jgi:site-specific recombinase XerD
MDESLRMKWEHCQKAWLESRRSENTRRSYEYALNAFLEFFWRGAGSMTREDVRTWAKALQQQGLKPATISARLGAISSFYSFAISEYQLMDHNPAEMKSIRPRVEHYAGSRALSTAESKKLLGACDLLTLVGLRDFVLLSGYLILGRRNTEWRSARIVDFELREDGYFFRWTGKGKSDVIHVPAQLWNLLSRYVAATGGRLFTDYIFWNRAGGGPISDRNVTRIVKDRAKEAGITGRVRVHDLRHTAAFLRREAGADVEEIRDFLNHSSLAITQIYLHKMERNSDKRAEEVCSNLLRSFV